MVLSFPGAWRFAPPRGDPTIEAIPDAAVSEFFNLIKRTATQGDPQSFLELFKTFFCRATGNSRMRSSSASWAETDLYDEMRSASDNPPLFIEAFFDACEATRARSPDYSAPDAGMINGVLQRHQIGYRIELPNLILSGVATGVVEVSERPPTLEDRALDTVQRSLHRAEELLAAGRGREAVQETLWLLETVTTAFRGVDTGSGTVEGRYFNRIVRDLRSAHHGTTFDRVLEWVISIHGFLSSPTGGGVRHGLDLREGLEPSPNEAKLFFNLIRSYLSFLLAEHQRLARSAR